ncbi:MAG: hypothetical protein R2815_01450 [Flavobacteriales bacterium]
MHQRDFDAYNRAFCPLPDVLRHVGRFVSENHGGEIKHNWQNPEDHKWYHHLHERLLYESDWSKTPQQGFVPNLSVSKPSVASGLIHPNGKEAGCSAYFKDKALDCTPM